MEDSEEKNRGEHVLRVLVCDDEPGMRLGIARALRNYVAPILDIRDGVRFSVEQAETGEEALRLVETALPGQRFDILLLDHKLPGISGIEVLERITPRQDDMLTIMITAYASIETAVRATKQGAYDFLPKPFTPSELKSAVGKAAERVIVTRRARNLEKEKRQVRFQFISVLAHELKSPLAAVEGYIEILRNPAICSNADTVKQILARCQSRMGYMRKMINDLLDLTRIESGQKRRQLGSVSLRAVAESAFDSVRPDAEARGITLHLEAEDAPTLIADAQELEIIMNNLVSNAVKYNRDGGRVEVRLDHEEGLARIQVRDTGIGMSREECARLFNDFVRIKNEKTKDILGSGLGLSIVRKIASLYQGEARVESEPDAGSVFTVVLNETVLED